jgi:lysosomal acid lipase/cholesteryl ester hydrolase
LYSIEFHSERLIIQDSSAAWVANSPSESLGYILHDADFDVWLGNVRGTTWGILHGREDYHTQQFWEFSWDEMANYDLPAM